MWKSSMELERFLPHSSSLILHGRPWPCFLPSWNTGRPVVSGLGWTGGSSGHKNSPCLSAFSGIFRSCSHLWGKQKNAIKNHSCANDTERILLASKAEFVSLEIKDSFHHTGTTILSSVELCYWHSRLHRRSNIKDPRWKAIHWDVLFKFLVLMVELRAKGYRIMEPY